MNDAQRLGAALMEANAFRIEDTNFHCSVSGTNLKEIGEAAWKQCHDFYGEQAFEIAHIDVEAIQLISLKTIGYQARVSARLK